MKIEKMGEKKEGFLEKLGECYSISTKNGTLSNTAHIILNLEYIRNADINELGETVFKKGGQNEKGLHFIIDDLNRVL